MVVRLTYFCTVWQQLSCASKPREHAFPQEDKSEAYHSSCSFKKLPSLREEWLVYIEDCVLVYAPVDQSPRAATLTAYQRRISFLETSARLGRNDIFSTLFKGLHSYSITFIQNWT